MGVFCKLSKFDTLIINHFSLQNDVKAFYFEQKNSQNIKFHVWTLEQLCLTALQIYTYRSTKRYAYF